MCCSDRLRMPEVCSLFINFLKVIFLTMANGRNVCSFGLGFLKEQGRKDGWLLWAQCQNRMPCSTPQARDNTQVL